MTPVGVGGSDMFSPDACNLEFRIIDTSHMGRNDLPRRQAAMVRPVFVADMCYLIPVQAPPQSILVG